MKTTEQLQSRIRECLAEELERRLKRGSRRLPVLCSHNLRHPLDTRRMVGDGEPNEGYNRITSADGVSVQQTMGLCMLNADGEWNGDICEDPIDAQRCAFFHPRLDKQGIYEEFRRDVADPVWVSQHLPEVSVLCWILELETVPRLSWWRRLWFWLRRVRLEPVRMTPDLTKLLPSSSREGLDV